jgi:ABC-2 type transport system permease protein
VTSLSQFKTVLKFEYFAYVKNKVFIIITAAVAAIIILGINVPNIRNLFGSSGDTEITESGQGGESSASRAESHATRRAAIHDPLNHYDDALLGNFFRDFRFTRYDGFDAEYQREKVQSEQYEFALSVSGKDYILIENTGGRGMMSFDTTSQDIFRMILITYQRNLILGYGLDETQAAQIQYAAPERHRIDGDRIGVDVAQTFWVGYVMLILLYMSVQFYGQFVATSVVTEKSSKTMELLVTSVKPIHLMFGKVLGSGFAGLTQLCVFLLSAFVMISLTIDQWDLFSPEMADLLRQSFTIEIILYAILFFILAFVKFSFLFAAFASTISRTEDVGKVITVPLILFIASFFIAMFFGMADHTSSFYVTASFIPFLSPLIMFMRICITGVGVPMAQVLLSVGINVATIVLVGILSAKIYRAGVLMYGKPMSVVEMFKQLRKA